MAETNKYISQYRATDGTVFLLKDREVREALKSKANAASLGVATKRIDDLEENSVTHDELSAAISDIDIIDKTTRQLAVMYFLPPYQEGKVYQKDMMIRMNGRVFKSLVDNNEAVPFTVITDSDGTVIFNENWQAIILDDVMSENWAQLSEELIPTSSIPDRMSLLETRMSVFDDVASNALVSLQDNINEFVEQKKSDINQLLQSYKDTINEAQSLIRQQSETIRNLQHRIEWMDNLTIIVSENRNENDSYSDNVNQ